MKKLTLNIQELSVEEQINIEGGSMRTLLKWGKRLLEVAGAVDAMNDFVDGWNSVDCPPR
ncbi:hypothetical protein ACYSNM_13665 [Myroides sp. LJL116]